MRLRLKQWKGRIVLFLVLCMMAVLAGCSRETLGTETFGMETGASGMGIEASDMEMKASGAEAGTSGMEAGVSGTEMGTSGMENETPETKIAGGSAQGAEPDDLGTAQKEAIDEEGSYTTAEDVSLYLHTYDKLPHNFITKQEARQLGWEGGSLEPYAPGKCIGGDRFGNYEGLLPEEKGRTYRECDIDTLGADSRGAKRMVYSNDGLIYYTQDHYASFTLLYD